jgi:hypothetical protein
MMRLLSLPVLGGGALLASPALWSALVDATMSLETALTRCAIGVLVAWVGLSLLRSLVEGTAGPAAPGPPPDAAPTAEMQPVRASVVDPRDRHAG